MKAYEKDQKFFYENIAENFDGYMNKYDLGKRLKLVFEVFLKDEELKGKKFLDLGCGTGWFSKEAVDRGARVTSLDVGPNLLGKTKERCKGKSKLVIGDALSLPFANDFFDIVLSSEVIEHTENPLKAISESIRVLRPEGILVLTTPNKFWYPAIFLANKMNLRPYEGMENWISFWGLKKTIQKMGLKIEKMLDFHAFPFFHPSVYPLLDFFELFGKTFGFLMLNLGVKARKGFG